MRTDFFESQDRARRQTGRLVGFFIVGVVATIAAMWIVAALLLGAGSGDYAGAFTNLPLLGGITVVIGGIVGVVTLVKLVQMSQGGEQIARMLGGEPIHQGTRDRAERELLHIVEEMSIASGVPVPPVFVMETPSINAFAAGPDPSRSVIGVTRGCMELLTRDELQGVIAHEYSHIFHGDTRINARTTAVIAGIMAVGTLGYVIFRYIGPSIARSGGGRRKNDGAAVGIGLIVAGLAIWAIGSLGMLFGRLIQAAISRQREFLADAAAVQYTRNPDGIGGALAKIRDHHAARIESPRASELNHFFFASSLDSLFATHPPLDERIRRIRAMGATALDAREARREADGAGRAPRATDGAPRIGAGGIPVAGFAAAEAVARAGTLDAGAIARAHALRESLAGPLETALHTPEGARAVCYLVARRHAGHERCDAVVAERDRAAYATYAAIATAVAALPADRQLALVDLAAPALFALGAGGYRGFRETLALAIRSDGQTDLREWALAKALERHVERRFARTPAKANASLARHADAVRTVLALAASAGHGEADARDAFARAYTVLGQPAPAMPSADRRTLDALDAAVRELGTLMFTERGRLLEACGAAASHDGAVTPEEHLVVRAVADALDVPVPALA